MKYVRSAMFPARLAALRPMGAFLEGFCAAAGIGRAPCLRLNLLLEELFTNTVRHGHRGDCDAPVWVTLSARPASVDLVYEDTAPPFNPYAELAEPLDGALEKRKVGGLGVLLTKELTASRDYAYLFGRNRIKLALAR